VDNSGTHIYGFTFYTTLKLWSGGTRLIGLDQDSFLLFILIHK
jgi:hypothetical protein